MDFYKQLLRYKGKEVEIYTLGDNNKETGTITNIVTSVGDNGVFVMLDDKILINIRHITKIIVKD